MALYKAKLAPDGVVVLHISNRHLELASVAAGIAAANGLMTWVYDGEGEEDQDENYMYSSEVAVSAVRADDVGELAESKAWKATAPDPRQRVWTDDYSNIVSAIIRRSF